MGRHAFDDDLIRRRLTASRRELEVLEEIGGDVSEWPAIPADYLAGRYRAFRHRLLKAGAPNSVGARGRFCRIADIALHPLVIQGDVWRHRSSTWSGKAAAVYRDVDAGYPRCVVGGQESGCRRYVRRPTSTPPLRAQLLRC